MLPKKDDKFDQVITHLKTTELATMSSKYAQVRIKVVDCQLDAFRGITTLAPNVQASSSNTAVDARLDMGENSHINRHAFTGGLSDDPMLAMADGWESLIEWER